LFSFDLPSSGTNSRAIQSLPCTARSVSWCVWPAVLEGPGLASNGKIPGAIMLVSDCVILKTAALDSTEGVGGPLLCAGRAGVSSLLNTAAYCEKRTV